MWCTRGTEMASNVTAARSRLRAGGVLAAALLFFTLPVSALDFGGILESSAEGRETTEGEVALDLSNSAQLFVGRNPVVDGPLTFRWDAQASARHHAAFVDGEFDDERWIFDVDRLDLRWIAPEAVAENSVFRGSVGRFPFAETTGLIFDDRIDGASLSLDFPAVTTAVSAGYTGFLTKENSEVAVSAVSVDDMNDREDDDIRFAPPRLVSNVSFVFPEIVGRQSMSLEALAQWDLRDTIDEIDFERVHSQYLYITGNGPITEALYYDVALAGGSLQRSTAADDGGSLDDPEQEFGIAGHLRSELFLDEAGRNLVTTTLRYGSGSQGPLDAFQSVAPSDIGVLEPVPVADTTAAILDYSFNPFADRRGAASRRLEIGAFAAVEYSGDLTETDSYRGAQFGSRLTTRPFSEFGAQVQGGARYDNSTDELLPIGRAELSARF